MGEVNEELRLDLKVAAVMMREAARNITGEKRTDRYWTIADKCDNYREGMEEPITGSELKEIQWIAARYAPLN